jgi:hypothetical protein
MPFPGEQVPAHAARQLDQRRRLWRLVPRHESSMGSYVRFMHLKQAMSANILAAPRRRDPLLASDVSTRVSGLDLPNRLSLSERHVPLETGGNGTLMARDLGTRACAQHR